MEKRGKITQKTIFPFFFLFMLFYSCDCPARVKSASRTSAEAEAQELSIPKDAELLEITEFKNDSIPYITEHRYRLPSGKMLYAYYEIEIDDSGNDAAQKREQTPLLSLGMDVNISGMPGYREFNFKNDRRRLVQFMKLFKLGQPDYKGKVKTPSLSDLIFRPTANWRDDFILLLDLYDETWVLEHRRWGGSGFELISTDTIKIARVNEYSDG